MRGALAAIVMLAFASITTHAQAPSDVDDLLARIAARVVQFYKRAKNVVCIETSTVQAIDLNHSIVGFARTVESELRIEADSDQNAGEATVVRTVRKVNGRVPRERDKKDRAGCTDPSPVASEPLAFLLPERRSEYEFRIAGTESDRKRPAVAIDFASVNRSSRSKLIEAPSGHDDCFDWSGHIALKGRIWVDASTYDVLRVDRGLRGPVDVDVPMLIQRRHHLDNRVVIMRDDLTMRYTPVAFDDPDEVVLLPQSIDSITMVRGGLQSTRRSQRFADYKRFVAEGKVLP